MTLLHHIASLHSGMYAPPASLPTLACLQVRHFTDQGALLQPPPPELALNHSTRKHLLQAGDVLFTLKGSKLFAALVHQHMLPAVAATSFLVIRPQQGRVLPAYLAWYLNLPLTHASLQQEKHGSKLLGLTKSTLENLPIPLPDLLTQQLVVQVAELRHTEAQLQHRLHTLQEKYLQHQLMLAINP